MAKELIISKEKEHEIIEIIKTIYADTDKEHHPHGDCFYNSFSLDVGAYLLNNFEFGQD